MKKLLILSVLTISICYAHEEENPDSLRIKSLIRKSYGSIEKFGKVIDTLQFTTIFTSDINGNTIRKEIYDSKDELISIGTWDYTNNKLMSITKKNRFGDIRVKKTIEYIDDTTIATQYNSDGNVIEKIIFSHTSYKKYNEEGKLVLREEYEYNDNNNMVKQITYKYDEEFGERREKSLDEIEYFLKD